MQSANTATKGGRKRDRTLDKNRASQKGATVNGGAKQTCAASEDHSAQRTELLPQSPGVFEPDSYASTAFAEILDRSVHATTAKFTGGLSPSALTAAYLDWATHLAASPGKQLQLLHKATKKWMRFVNYALASTSGQERGECCIEPLPQDRRFRGDAWQQYPYNLIHQAFLLNQQWWHNATTEVRGVTKQHERLAEFVSRQLLDMFAPSNFILTNPEVLAHTYREGGANFIKGWQNLLQDWERIASGKKPVGCENFTLGENIAATRGKVIYQNRLIELIQYEPATPQVRPEPILIVPAWIMKYYILDLSPDNSLVRYLTGQGFTVFMISWKNPTPDDRNLGMSDYLSLGIREAVEAVRSITGSNQVHGVGYCLGGTLLAIAAAAMARDEEDLFRSLSFFAAQVDFTEAGELTLFINESQVTFLEDMMWEQGFLDTQQMAGAFQLLRSNDLIWSRLTHEYLMGERRPMSDLMAWNADATRLPYKMHSEYLRDLFLNNDLAEGRYRVDDRTVSITDIKVPILVVATESDHVAPWRSVYKFRLLSDAEVTFVLTNGGHNAGIVSEPGHHGRHYRMATLSEAQNYRDPETWVAETEIAEGSWWPAWTDWLAARSGEPVDPPKTGKSGSKYAAIRNAPGAYVVEA